MSYQHRANLLGSRQYQPDSTQAGFITTRAIWASIMGHPENELISPAFPTELHMAHALTSINSVDAMSWELTDEQQVKTLGYDGLFVSKEAQGTGNINFQGGTNYELMAMIGKHMHNRDGAGGNGEDISSSIALGKNYGVRGHLIYYIGYSENKGQDWSLNGSICIPNVGLRVLNSPSFEEGGSSYDVEIFTDYPALYATKGVAFFPFYFYDDGTGSGITNAAAPDGAEVNFDLKDANNAWIGSAPTGNLRLQRVNPLLAGGSNPLEYIVALRLNGELVSPSAFSVNPATGVITMNSAPADGAKLEGIAAVRTGVQTHLGANEDRNFYIGEVVDYSSNYYQKKTNVQGTLPTVTDDWDVLSNVTFKVPYLSDLDLAEFGQSGYKPAIMHDWLAYQREAL